ncbi:MAG: DUF1684 domain-containing protein [Ignavibacteria bacterium]|nr:MAG: DUF1684 domain-containing protein [Ignavibacteria bacterium]
MRKISLLFVLLFIMSSCSNELKENGSPEYIQSINDWHSKRIENLKKPDGWLSLVGLYWLNEGVNTFGSAKDNDIVFPEGTADDHIGEFIKKDSVITLKVYDNVKVLSKEMPVKETILIDDTKPNRTVLNHKNLIFYVIKRGPDKYGIRLKDTHSKLLKEFKGIERFPVNVDWKFNAKFVPYNPPKELNIPTIIGTIEKEMSLGKLVFSKDGNEYSLDVTNAGDSFFIVFADETSGEETYGAGRFLYTSKPDSNGIVVLDFNKAYNPPCAFTKYATCPLPTKDNYLKLKVTAGEKNYGHGH